MYYVIESKYVGPNREDHLTDHEIAIATKPGITIRHEEKTNGDLGTWGDWAGYAYGEYKTMDEAREKVASICSDEGFREGPDSDDPNDVEVYIVGEYPKLNRSETGDHIYEGLSIDISASTTDAEIEGLADQYDNDAREHNGFTLDIDVCEEMMREHRDSLIIEEKENETANQSN